MDNAIHFSNQKRKGFLSNVFGRSSNADKSDEKKDDEQPESKGFMNSVSHGISFSRAYIQSFTHLCHAVHSSWSTRVKRSQTRPSMSLRMKRQRRSKRS